jgi:hypothetical protein
MATLRSGAEQLTRRSTREVPDLLSEAKPVRCSGPGSLKRLMAPVVALRGAVSLLGRFPALAGVDLDVEPGDCA